MNKRNSSNLLAAFLAAGVLALAPDARAQVRTDVSGSVAGAQSETACSISVFPDRVVEVIVANDNVEGGGFTYDIDAEYEDDDYPGYEVGEEPVGSNGRRRRRSRRTSPNPS